MSDQTISSIKEDDSSIYELIDLLTQFQKIERGINVPGTNRPENDSEHSYNLALTAWFIIDKDRLPLDKEKVLKYALIHDWPEIYAGDAFALDPNQVAVKEEKEIAARKILANDPLSSGFSEVIEEYEKLDNEESRFVYSLDKLMPALIILKNQSTLHKDHGFSQADWKNKFKAKIELSPHTKPYLDCVISQIKRNPHLFAE